MLFGLRRSDLPKRFIYIKKDYRNRDNHTIAPFCIFANIYRLSRNMIIRKIINAIGNKNPGENGA